MKKLIAGAVIATVSSFAMAGTGPGCGVGTMIFKGQSGVAPHILAATTNGTFGNQTFGMTSGTLGCDANKAIVSTAMYMDNNMDNIARDMSRGEGENLTTLAVLLGVEQQDRDAFAATLQQNFAAIFPTESTTSDEAVQAIIDVMKANQALAKYVG